jgi:tRNA G18 (ribose-2'-O)-methylase SpoU
LGNADSPREFGQVGDLTQVLQELRAENFRIIGLELDERAIELSKYQPKEKMALLLGNEVEGIPPSVRDLCDDLIQIPQRGKKESLNVSVATGIAAYRLLQSV